MVCVVQCRGTIGNICDEFLDPQKKRKAIAAAEQYYQEIRSQAES